MKIDTYPNHERAAQASPESHMALAGLIKRGWHHVREKRAALKFEQAKNKLGGEIEMIRRMPDRPKTLKPRFITDPSDKKNGGTINVHIDETEVEAVTTVELLRTTGYHIDSKNGERIRILYGHQGVVQVGVSQMRFDHRSGYDPKYERVWPTEASNPNFPLSNTQVAKYLGAVAELMPLYTAQLKAETLAAQRAA